jgi:hypothetical protein
MKVSNQATRLMSEYQRESFDRSYNGRVYCERSHIMTSPNKPDPTNQAIALWLTIEDQRHRVADLERSVIDA